MPQYRLLTFLFYIYIFVMQYYKSKSKPFTGTNYKEISRKALSAYREISRKTRRRPYVRSVYFNKQKIFLGLFWSHLHQKNQWDRMRRMKYFACGLELIVKSRFEPISKENPNRPIEILHRFYGLTPTNKRFSVQIKEDKRTAERHLISVYPVEKDDF